MEGIIRPSESPYASLIVLVRKGGKIRMYIDYPAVNKVIERDRFPLPLLEDCLEYFSGKKYFTILDMKKGFHQALMHKDSLPITAFVTPRMNMGMNTRYTICCNTSQPTVCSKPWRLNLLEAE